MMPGQTQEAFFARITGALRDRGKPVDLPDDLQVARVMGADRDLVTVFIERSRQVGMHPQQVPDEQTAADKVVEIISAAGGTSAIVPDEEIPARDRILARLQEKGIHLSDLNERDAAFDADFGITGVACAIAETGSLCVDSGDGRRRLASLAVPNHIAVVRADQIVPDLLDWAARFPADIPANRVLISAPSKTADIEMTLVEGVHGPKMVHIVIIG